MRNLILCVGAMLITCGWGVDTSRAQAEEALRTLDQLQVRDEDWCTRYRRDDYAYPPSAEQEVIRLQRGMFSPYDGTCFRSRRESDIEHIVALAEAHRSGMCARGLREKVAFASDPLNLTLATPTLNREEKVAKDAAAWLPAENRCWFANRVVQVKRKYRLTVDRNEAHALRKVLRRCESVHMMIPACNSGWER